MKTVAVLCLLLGAATAAAQEGPADRLWELYKEGRFEDVVREGKVELTTGTPTAQVNLAVGRSLVDLEKFEEGLVYLATAVRMDGGRTWVFAWAQNYLGKAYFNLRQMAEARTAWILARDCGATHNSTRFAEGMLNVLGLAEFYDDWDTFNTGHFAFRYSPNLEDFDGVTFARRHEEAFEVISAWFGGGPKDPISFFVWTGNEEASIAGLPPLGFSRSEFNLVHARADQTVGHEMTHVIAVKALEPEVVEGLISEGIAVYHDQTGRDRLALARAALAGEQDRQVKVSVAALWNDWTLQPVEISYPVAGAWVEVLIDKGGKEKFLEFFRDQSLAHARRVYGADLQTWLDEFDAVLYQ